MSVNVPPLPYKTMVTNDDGRMSEPWAKWFRQVFTRIGGNVALSNTQLAEQFSTTDVGTLTTRMTTLETTVAALSAQAPGLGLGPVL